MTFQETLDFLYQQLPVFHKIGAKAYKKDLKRTLDLLELFGNPHIGLPCIHIAGTNGKGSSSHFIASILQEAGYKIGLYTSPHVKHFGERIKLNGKYIEEQFVIDFVEKAKPYLAEIEPSFFELTVVLALDYFKQKSIDIAVIETGLGGRLDSTNVVDPMLCLITNISFDHMDLLGHTLPEIAKEKAGIIKPKVPVVISERQPEVESVFEETSYANGSPLQFASDNYRVNKLATNDNYLAVKVYKKDSEMGQFKLGLTGHYQIKNLPGVLNTIEILRSKGVSISDAAVSQGLEKVVINTGLKGRWQTIQENPRVVCDIAHNAAGIATLLDTVASLNPIKLHVILGMVKDKDPGKVLQLLPKEAHYYFTHAHTPRALPASELQTKANTFGLNGNLFEDVNLALTEALKIAQKQDLILICGSTFVIAEVDGV